jgi:hypothetical protein
MELSTHFLQNVQNDCLQLHLFKDNMTQQFEQLI